MSTSTTQKPTTLLIVGMVVGIVIIGLGIALFKDLFSLIVGADFREGIFILPVVLGANVLTGVWLNLSFWYLSLIHI